MDFADKIEALAQRIAKQKDSVETEEATKNAFIMPFLAGLGYDVFNPLEVVPEFTADLGVKKGEKVDYAVKLDGKVVILVECKPCRGALATQHMSQLFRYFSVTDARFAILTNGIVYWFYSDLDHTNKMDEKPFFEFDMLDHTQAQVAELKKFARDNFNIDSILETASDLKYGSLLMREIATEIETPSEDLMRLLIGRIYHGKLTANALGKYGPLVQKAMKDTVRDLVNRRLSSAMETSYAPSTIAGEASGDAGEQDQGAEDLTDIVTTQEEIDAFHIVRAIVREVVKVERIQMRDAKSYCAILLDDNNRKPICRLHFNRSSKYVGIFDEAKNEEKIPIDKLDDIFALAQKLKATAAGYDDVPQGETATV